MFGGVVWWGVLFGGFLHIILILLFSLKSHRLSHRNNTKYLLKILSINVLCRRNFSPVEEVLGRFSSTGSREDHMHRNNTAFKLMCITFSVSNA